MGVVRFIRVRWICSGASCVSSGSLGFFGFIRLGVHSCWLVSFGRVLAFGGFIRARPEGRWVNSGSFI